MSKRVVKKAPTGVANGAVAPAPQTNLPVSSKSSKVPSPPTKPRSELWPNKPTTSKSQSSSRSATPTPIPIPVESVKAKVVDQKVKVNQTNTTTSTIKSKMNGKPQEEVQVYELNLEEDGSPSQEKKVNLQFNSTSSLASSTDNLPSSTPSVPFSIFVFQLQSNLTFSGSA